MSHEITDRDGLVLVGERAWHGLGTVLPEQALAPREALRIARLDWRVTVAPIFARTTAPVVTAEGPGTIPVEHDAPEHRAIVREDTGDVLGVVGSGFSPVQNTDLAELLQALGRPVETMGSLRGGRVVFGLLRQGEFRVGAGDRVRQYLLAANGHDGSRALSFTPTDVRVVCANTLAMAEGRGAAAVRLLHTSGLPERIRAASKALESAEALVTVQRTESQHLADTAWDGDTVDRYHGRTVEDIVGLPAGSVIVRRSGAVTLLDTATGRADAVQHPHHVERARSLVADLRALDGHSFQRIAPAGSAWRAFQGVSHWAHHVRKGRQDAVESRMSGAVAGIVSRAFRRALVLSGR